MKAIVQRVYGSPSELRLENIQAPVPGDDDVLVRSRASSVNALDWRLTRGLPYLVRLEAGIRKPKNPVRGVDVSGVVEAVGTNVTAFSPGDEVFAEAPGAFAEYVLVPEYRLARKPANFTFDQAGTVPLAGVTALQAIRKGGQVESGRKVLINGASGGVGTFAVQIAKAFGADVTAVCSPRNVAMVEAIGADSVVDYTNEDFVSRSERYDLILDIVANRSIADLSSVLEPDGILVQVGFKTMSNVAGPIRRIVELQIQGRRNGQKQMKPLLARANREDLVFLRGLCEAGLIKPVIDRSFSLDRVPEAVGRLESGEAQGKFVITF